MFVLEYVLWYWIFFRLSNFFFWFDLFFIVKFKWDSRGFFFDFYGIFVSFGGNSVNLLTQWNALVQSFRSTLQVLVKEMQLIDNGLRNCDYSQRRSNIFTTNWPMGARSRIVCLRLIQLSVYIASPPFSKRTTQRRILVPISTTWIHPRWGESLKYICICMHQIYSHSIHWETMQHYTKNEHLADG